MAMQSLLISYIIVWHKLNQYPFQAEMGVQSLPPYPRANGAKRRSRRKPGARVTNSARLFTPG